MFYFFHFAAFHHLFAQVNGTKLCHHSHGEKHLRSKNYERRAEKTEENWQEVTQQVEEKSKTSTPGGERIEMDFRMSLCIQGGNEVNL
jgi:hypothetical protein